MFKKRFLILIGLLVLLGAVAHQSFAQEFTDELFNKLTLLAKTDSELLPLMLNEVFPQGIVPVGPVDPNAADQTGAAEVILGEFFKRADALIGVTESLALNTDSSSKVRDAALRVENFVQYYKTLVEMANQDPALLEPPTVPDVGAGQVTQGVVIIRQFVNPLFITWWKPWPDSPRDIEEKVFTAEIPIWGAAVIVKEVRGIKLELVKGPLPINPCWWWRLSRHWNLRWDWHWPWYYYRLVPAEFIKTISYVNTWNYEKRQPEVIKKVEQDVVIDEALMKFWWFLSDPSVAAPEKEAGDLPNMGSTQKKALRKAVVWGNLKRSKL